MKTEPSSFFDSFESSCKSTLNNTEYADYCMPIRKQVEATANWFQDMGESLYQLGKSGWEKTGRQFGLTGQLGLTLVVAGIAYNVLSGKKKQSDGNKHIPCKCHGLR